ncbi:MAG: hypothetical protein QXQ02_01520 [Halobacteria archaeon]
MVDEQNYVSVMPEQIRIKIVGAVDVDPQFTLSDNEAATYGILDAVQRAYEKICKSETLLKRFPIDYTFLHPEPEILVLKRNDVLSLIKFIKERTNIDPYKEPVSFTYRSKTFLLSIEHSCG